MKASDPLAVVMRMVATRLFGRCSDNDTLRKIMRLWETPGKNFTERREIFPVQIAGLDIANLWRLQIDLLVVGGSLCSEWSMNYEPAALLDMADLFEIDAGAVREEIETKEQAATPAPAEPTPAPSQAAPAAEASARKKAAQAGEKTAKAKSKTPPTDAGLIETNEKPTAAGYVLSRCDRTVDMFAEKAE